MLNKIAIALFATAYTANARPVMKFAQTERPVMKFAQMERPVMKMSQTEGIWAQTKNDSLSTLGENCRGFDGRTGGAFPECEGGLVCGGLFDIVTIPGMHCRCMDPFDFETGSENGDAYQC